MKSLTLPPLFVSPNPFRCAESLMIARLIRRYASSFSESSTVFSAVLNTCGKLAGLNTNRVRGETWCVERSPDLKNSSFTPHRIPYIFRIGSTFSLIAAPRALSLVLYSLFSGTFFSARPACSQPVIHISFLRSFFIELLSSQRFSADDRKVIHTFHPPYG